MGVFWLEAQGGVVLLIEMGDSGRELVGEEWEMKRQNHKVWLGFVEMGVAGCKRHQEMGPSRDSIQVSPDIFPGES